MKTIIAGSRNYERFDVLLEAIGKLPWTITEVVSGAATGVDRMGERFARMKALPLHRYPVSPEEWRQIGPAAGPMRNRKMAENAEALLALWDGVSRGTKNMIREARARGLRVHVHNI